MRLTKCCGEVASLPSYAAVFFERSPGGFLVRPNEQTILRCFNFFATRRHFFFFLKRKERADIATERLLLLFRLLFAVHDRDSEDVCIVSIFFFPSLHRRTKSFRSKRQRWPRPVVVPDSGFYRYYIPSFFFAGSPVCRHYCAGAGLLNSGFSRQPLRGASHSNSGCRLAIGRCGGAPVAVAVAPHYAGPGMGRFAFLDECLLLECSLHTHSTKLSFRTSSPFSFIFYKKNLLFFCLNVGSVFADGRRF